jgi:hypothetical protein
MMDESVGCAGFEEKQPEGERNFWFSEVVASAGPLRIGSAARCGLRWINVRFSGMIDQERSAFPFMRSRLTCSGRAKPASSRGVGVVLRKVWSRP